MGAKLTLRLCRLDMFRVVLANSGSSLSSSGPGVDSLAKTGPADLCTMAAVIVCVCTNVSVISAATVVVSSWIEEAELDGFRIDRPGT